MDWRECSIRLANQGYTRSGIYSYICDQYARLKLTPPTLGAMTSYLRRHKSEWYNPQLEAEKESEANKRVISEGEVTFAELKRYTIKAAEELYYDQSYISQLKHATTEGELGRIMATARERSYQD